jgi:hypothetical protein
MADLDFPFEVREFVYRRAGSTCECTAACSIHPKGRCDMVFWRPSAANFHALKLDAPPTSANCIMLCNYCLRQAMKTGK